MTTRHTPSEQEQEVINRAGFLAAYNVLNDILDIDEERDQVKNCMKAFEAAISAVKKEERRLTMLHMVDMVSSITDESILVFSAFEAILSGSTPEERPSSSVGGFAIQAMVRTCIAYRHVTDLEYILSCEDDLSTRLTQKLANAVIDMD